MVVHWPSSKCCGYDDALFTSPSTRSGELALVKLLRVNHWRWKPLRIKVAHVPKALEAEWAQYNISYGSKLQTDREWTARDVNVPWHVEKLAIDPFLADHHQYHIEKLHTDVSTSVATAARIPGLPLSLNYVIEKPGWARSSELPGVGTSLARLG